MEVFALILIIALIGAIIFFNSKNKNQKSAIVKKHEISENYEKMMQELIYKHKDDKTLLLQEKTKLLKQINSELSRNIFFTPQESKELIKKLLNL